MNKEAQTEKVVEKILDRVSTLKEEKPYLFEETIETGLINLSQCRTLEELNCLKENLRDERIDEIIEAERDLILWIEKELEKDSEIKEFLKNPENRTRVIDEIEYLLSADLDTKDWVSEIVLAPYQFKNFDTEGEELMNGIRDTQKFIDGKANEIERMPEVIEKLFESQGYQIVDLKDKEKVQNSKFLNSFYEEIQNADLYNPLFFAVLGKLSFEEYGKLLETNLSFIRKNSNPEIKGEWIIGPSKENIIGFYNPIQGAGSTLDIKLEKEFKFPICETNIIATKCCNYGYNLYSIYGEFEPQEIKFVLGGRTDEKSEI